MGDYGADAASEREMAIFRAKHDRDLRKQELDEHEAHLREHEQFYPRQEDDFGKERLLAEQECSRRIAEAWADYWKRCVAEHDQKWEPQRTWLSDE